MEAEQKKLEEQKLKEIEEMKAFAERNGFELTIEKERDEEKRPRKSRVTKVSTLKSEI